MPHQNTSSDDPIPRTPQPQTHARKDRAGTSWISLPCVRPCYFLNRRTRTLGDRLLALICSRFATSDRIGVHVIAPGEARCLDVPDHLNSEPGGKRVQPKHPSQRPIHFNRQFPGETTPRAVRTLSNTKLNKRQQGTTGPEFRAQPISCFPPKRCQRFWRETPALLE